MVNDKRRLWSILFVLGIFAPIAVVVFIRFFFPGPQVSAETAPAPPDIPALGSMLARPRSVAPAGSHAQGAPLLAVGDAHDLWVAHPYILDPPDSLKGFEMLHRAGNSGVWAVATHGADAFWLSYPQALALLPATASQFSEAVPFVFNEGGNVEMFSLDDKTISESLPATHIVKAVAGSEAGLFAITLGAPVAAATRPGDRLTPEISYLRPGTLPADAPTPASAEATTAVATFPATASAAVPPSFNAYWFKSGHWILLPPLGQSGADTTLVPTPNSSVSMAVSGTQLLALWVDSMRPGELVVRSLDISKPIIDLTWSAPIVTELPQQVPTVSRLLTATLDKTLYVLWTVPTPQSMVELRGGTLNAEFKLPPKNFLPPMSLGTAGMGIAPETDVAVGPSENSLIAVVITKDGTLATVTFDDRGRRVAGPTAVVPRTISYDLEIGQNLILVLLILVFSLSLWQWRQKPIALALPTGMVEAPLYLRAFAFLIDAAIPYAVTILLFGLWDNPFGPLSAWFSGLAHPNDLMRSPDFFVFLGLYLLHVTLGELIFRRSLGKALLGLQVLMMDGKSPTVAAILLRNLVRIPECAFGFVILYVMISDHRQRLGDLLARTLVVASSPPETPPDPDKDIREK